MTQRSTLRRLWAGLITALFLAWAPGSQAAPTLIWLLRDLPPLTVFHGPQKGKGIVDQVMPALIAGMPQYQHVIMRVNRARALQMLEEPSLTCDPALIWNPARALSIVYSEPVAIMHSNGMAILRENQHLIEPFVHDDKVDLPGLLKAQTLKLGVIAKRSYGVLIDSQLKLSPPGQIVMHYGNDPLGSLLQMQHAGRMPYADAIGLLARNPGQGQSARFVIRRTAVLSDPGRPGISVDLRWLLGHCART